MAFSHGGDAVVNPLDLLCIDEGAPQSLARARRVRTIHGGCGLTALGARLEGAQQQARTKAIVEAHQLFAAVVALALVARLADAGLDDACIWLAPASRVGVGHGHPGRGIRQGL